MSYISGSAAIVAPGRHTELGDGVARQRNVALDFTKGALVLCMVAYHAVNYFANDVAVLRHLHFLPPSFIFITGFLVTHVYLPKSHSGDRRVYARLLVRGLKVLAVFLGANVIVQALFATSFNRNLSLAAFLANLDDVLFVGNHRASVFPVLLPISYLLLLSSVLLRIARAVPYALHLIAVGSFVLCAILAQRDELDFNADLLSMGLFGMLVGFAPKDRLDSLAASLPGIAAIYLAYGIATHVWYPTYLINGVGVALSLLLLYAIGRRVEGGGFMAEAITLLGNYSLLAYLGQIAVLQMLFRVARWFGVIRNDVWVAFGATVLLTFVIVQAVDFARRRSRVANSAYKTVFA